MRWLLTLLFSASMWAQIPMGGVTYSGVGCTSANLYTTTFSGTENPLREASCWLDSAADNGGRSNMQKTPGIAFGTQVEQVTPIFNDSIALFNGTAGPDQTVKVTLKENTLGTPGTCCREWEIWTRGGMGAGVMTGYEMSMSALSNPDYYHMAPWLGTDFATGTMAGSTLGRVLADGDQMVISSVGSTHTFRVNGIRIARGTDATYATGKPGLGNYHSSSYNGTDANWGFSKWSFGDKVASIEDTQGDSAVAGTTLILTPVVPISVGQHVVVCAGSVTNGATITVTDNGTTGGNTYTRRTATNGSSNTTNSPPTGLETTCFDSFAVSKSATQITITWGASNGFRAGCSWQFTTSSGTSAFDVGAGTTNAAAVGTSASGASVTTTTIGYSVGILIPNNAVSITNGAGNPLLGNEYIDGGGKTTNGTGCVSLVNSTAGSHQPVWLMATSADKFASSTWSGKAQ